MNWYSILQSILVYALTSFAVACATWAARTSKRITKLEEHDKAQAQSLAKLDKMNEALVQLTTKVDLLLQGQLRVEYGNR